jgi:hypothetical protein
VGRVLCSSRQLGGGRGGSGAHRCGEIKNTPLCEEERGGSGGELASGAMKGGMRKRCSEEQLQRCSSAKSTVVDGSCDISFSRCGFGGCERAQNKTATALLGMLLE